MDTSLLEKPFEPGQIKQRRGRNGHILDYLETPTVIRRLNQAFDFNWSFEVVSWNVVDNEVIVRGKLTAGGVVKMQFGSSQITKARESGQNIAPGDDFKAAGSDALKKCSTLFGIGLHLYSESEAATKAETSRSEMSTNQGNGKITPKQLQEVKRLRTQMSWTPEQAPNVVERMVGARDIMALNPLMGVKLIAHLHGCRNGSNGANAGTQAPL